MIATSDTHSRRVGRGTPREEGGGVVPAGQGLHD